MGSFQELLAADPELAAALSAAELAACFDAARTLRHVDAIYAKWLPGIGITALPARTAFQAAGLPAGALVMLDVVAAYPTD